jgi:hypothetical protein
MTLADLMVDAMTAEETANSLEEHRQSTAADDHPRDELDQSSDEHEWRYPTLQG